MSLPFDKFNLAPESVIGALELHERLGDDMRIVDMQPDSENHNDFICGAVRLDDKQLVRKVGEAEGLRPDRKVLTQLLDSLDIHPGTRVVSYDEGSGIGATRLLWILKTCGHRKCTLLDGGMKSWTANKLPVCPAPATVHPKSYRCTVDESVVADLAYIMDGLGRCDRCILDVRSEQEYRGRDQRAKHGGHIPGARNYEWKKMLNDDGTLKSPGRIRSELHEAGVDPACEIIVYCQSNRRASHTFHILKWLGCPRVRAYEGAWSEWGNSDATPIET